MNPARFFEVRPAGVVNVYDNLVNIPNKPDTEVTEGNFLVELRWGEYKGEVQGMENRGLSLCLLVVTQPCEVIQNKISHTLNGMHKAVATSLLGPTYTSNP